jgi:type II secretory pathway pseudopilin PulG
VLIVFGAVQVQGAERRASEAEARARALQQQLANARRSAQSAATSAHEELDALSVRPTHPITHTCVSELAQSRRFPTEYVAVSYAGTWRYI